MAPTTEENTESAEGSSPSVLSSGEEGLMLPSSPKLEWTMVVHEALPATWPKIKRMVRDAVRWSPFTRKLQTVNDVEEQLYSGVYTLWLCFDHGVIIGAVVTAVAEECQCKVLDVAYGAGERVGDWAPSLFEELDDYATEHDCRFIRIEGRPGWEKILNPLGFEEAYRAYMIEV